MAAAAAVARKIKTAKRAPAQIVTKDELAELCLLEASHADLSRRAADIERRVKAARLALAQKVLGVETDDQLKALDPATLERLMNVRGEKGMWKVQRGAAPFIFVKTSEGRYVQWKAEFVALKGEAEAEQKLADTPTRYSYKVDVAV
jgi:hypothetical protein